MNESTALRVSHYGFIRGHDRVSFFPTGSPLGTTELALREGNSRNRRKKAQEDLPTFAIFAPLFSAIPPFRL